MDQNFSGELDLFGDPIPADRYKRGRPAHVWTQENSHKIILLFATGSKPQDAAKVIGISYPTFRKHYFYEIEIYEVAQEKLRAKLLLNLVTQADQGSVAAIKELYHQMELGNIKRAADDVRNRMVDQKPEKPVKKGKKELQLDAAAAIDGKFAPRSGPELLN